MTSNFPLVKVNYSPLKGKISRSDDMGQYWATISSIRLRGNIINIPFGTFRNCAEAIFVPLEGQLSRQKKMRVRRQFDFTE
jgi:hypothetical protein